MFSIDRVITKFFYKNSPHNEGMYAYFGIFSTVSVFMTIHMIPQTLQMQYLQIINFLYLSVLSISTTLISYPLWVPNWKKSNVISIFWNISIFYILICVGLILVIISNFGQLQLMVLMINLIILAVLVKWQLALLMMISGFLLTTQFFKFYLGAEYLPEKFISAQFEITYIILLGNSILMVFLKPKQKPPSLIKKNNKNLNVQIDVQEKQAKRALAIKGEFIRNISNEHHASVTDITNIIEILDENYHILDDTKRHGAIKVIRESALKLEVFDSNISSLSALGKADYQLELESINLDKLLYDRARRCCKLYDKTNGDREFSADIQENVVINGDRFYLTQMLDNLIINAINYCKKGKINISLKQDEAGVHFVIEDEGIGIPAGELVDIFDKFVVSSKIPNPAGNRGIGLTLCKKVLEVHGGSIKAESDGEKGARFSFDLPSV